MRDKQCHADTEVNTHPASGEAQNKTLYQTLSQSQGKGRLWETPAFPIEVRRGLNNDVNMSHMPV